MGFSDVRRTDHKGRIHLGRFGVNPGDRFFVSSDDSGRIYLTPVTEGIFHDYDGYESGSLDALVQQRVAGEISQEDFDRLLTELAATEEPKKPDGEFYGYR